MFVRSCGFIWKPSTYVIKSRNHRFLRRGKSLRIGGFTVAGVHMLCWFSLAETEVTNPANHGDRGMMPGLIVAMNGPFEDDNAVDAVGSQCGWMKLN